MNPSMFATYDPANGFRMTASAAARRNGVSAHRPAFVKNFFHADTLLSDQHFRHAPGPFPEPASRSFAILRQLPRPAFLLADSAQPLDQAHPQQKSRRFAHRHPAPRFTSSSVNVADRLRNQVAPEIAVGRQFAGRNAHNRRMPRQIDRIGNDRGRSIGRSRAIRQHRDGIRDSQERNCARAIRWSRCRAPVSDACRVVVPNSDGRSGRSTIPTTKVSPGTQVQRDVSSIVHICARKLRSRRASPQESLPQPRPLRPPSA